MIVAFMAEFILCPLQCFYHFQNIKKNGWDIPFFFLENPYMWKIWQEAVAALKIMHSSLAIKQLHIHILGTALTWIPGLRTLTSTAHP